MFEPAKRQLVIFSYIFWVFGPDHKYMVLNKNKKEKKKERMKEKNIYIRFKLDRIAPFVADPTPTNSTTDTYTHPVSQGPTF